MLLGFNKKIGVLFLCILLVGTISALEFDNRQTYDVERKEVTITNAFGFGDDIAKVKLETPLINSVIRGEDRLVAEFTIDSFEDYNAFQNMEFLDIGDGLKEIDREFTYKVKSTYTVTEPDYVTTCGATHESCVTKKQGTRTRTVIEWTDLDSTKQLRTGLRTVGIFTDVVPGDNIEWIPTLFGERITEWAVWSESLNVDLFSYWAMEDKTATVLVDSIHNNNFTAMTNTPGNVTGIIKDAVNQTGTERINEAVVSEQDSTSADEFSWGCWVQASDIGSTGKIYTTGSDASFGSRELLVNGDAMKYFVGDGSSEISITGGSGLLNDTFYFVVGTVKEDDVIALYINGTQIGNTSITTLGDADTQLAMGANINTGNEPLLGALDECFYYNRTLSNSEISQLYNNGNGLTFTTSFPINVTVALDSPANATIFLAGATSIFNATLTPIVSDLTNGTLHIWNNSGDLVLQTVNSLSGNVTLNVTFDVTIPSLVQTYQWNILGCSENATLGVCEFDPVNRSFVVNSFVENSITFKPNTTEGNLEVFTLNMTIDPSLSVATAVLVYNNTNHSSVVVTVAPDTIVTSTALVPNVDTETNMSFYWDLIFSDTGRQNTTTNLQTVFHLIIDNCTVNTNVLFNFTLIDEESQLLLTNGTQIETAINIFSQDRTQEILNLSTLFLTNPVSVCLNQPLGENTVYSLDTVVRYEASQHAIEYYNIVNATLTNNTGPQVINLFDLNLGNSTTFQLTFTGENFLPVENALVSVDRQYISENVFKTVELPKTDFNGQTVLHLVKNDVVYNLRINKAGKLLGNFENIIAFCDDFSIGDCKINLNAFSTVEQAFDYSESLGLIFSPPTFNNVSNNVEFDYLTADGTSKIVSLQVTRNDIFGNRSICNDTLSSSGGTLSCGVPINIGETTLNVEVFVDEVLSFQDTVRLKDTDKGTIGFLVFFIMSMTMILMFSGSKTGVLIGVILAFISGIGFGLINSDLIGIGSSGIWILIVMILAIWKLNKGRPE